MKNNGKEYESFVQQLQQALLDSEDITKQKNIKVEKNVKINDNCEIDREFDLYWEYELAGVTYKTVIECKDYNSKVSVEKIDSLLGKIKDLPDLKPVFATRNGYQSGAKIKAQKNRVELLIVRDQDDSDWQDGEGNPYIKVVGMNLTFMPAARITQFVPEIDGRWAEENTDLDVSKSLNLHDRNDLTIIENDDKGEKYSILDLEEKLGHSDNSEFGELIHNESFENAYIRIDKMRLKLLSYTAYYVKSKPINIPMEIDFSKELIGVIEYLHRGSKTAVFSDKIVKEW